MNKLSCMKPSLNPEVQSEKPRSSSELYKTISEKADQMIATSLKVGRIMLIPMIGFVGSSEATAKPARQTADLTQAVKKGQSMQVMSELIRQLAKEKGKNYRWAMKQSDGSVIACSENAKEYGAIMDAEGKAHESLGGRRGVVMTYLEETVGSKNIVCVHGEKKKLSPMQAMSHLMQQFGDQYKWTGKQKDGSVIQCAKGNSFNDSNNKAYDLVINMLGSNLGRNFSLTILHMELADGTWVAAAKGKLGKATKRAKTTNGRRTRGLDSRDAATIDIGTLSTSGTAEVKMGRRNQVRPTPPKARKERERKSAGKVNASNLRSLLKKSQKAIQMCYERELKRDTNLHGKITARIVIGKSGNVSKVYFPKRGKTMRNTAIEACVSRVIHRWKFDKQKRATEVDLPFIFNAAG